MYKRCKYNIENEESIIKFIKGNEHYLINRPKVLQHGDYHIGNMIITPDVNLGIIDFNRSGYGDPFDEYDRFVFAWKKSIDFANGQLHGYFDGEPPEHFFRLLGLYTAVNMLSSIPWSIGFGEDEIKTALDNTKIIMSAYNNFKKNIPNWYKEMIYYKSN